MKAQPFPSMPIRLVNNRRGNLCSAENLKETAMKSKRSPTVAIALLMLMAVNAAAQATVDVEAAKELAKTNDCLKCHSADKDKKGPSMQKISDKYRGKPDAQEKVILHFTSGPTVTLPDGLEIRHRIIDTKDPKERANIADWFLSH